MECKFKSPTFNSSIQSLDTDCFYRQNNKNNVGYCKRPEYYQCVEDVWKKKTLLSHTGLQTFLTCHHLYYLKYIRGIEILKHMLSNPLKMGILWDACLQYYLNSGSVDLNEIVNEYQIDDFCVAKVHALYKALKALEIKIDSNCSIQESFFYNLELDGYDTTDKPIVTVNGKYDRKYDDGFVETKLSGRPDNYLDIFFLQSQIGTYFSVDKNLKYCIMEISRTPDLKSTGKYKDETAEQYEERCYQDIISRPSFYFIGYNKDTATYGKKFYRTEFDIEEIVDRYKHVAREIREAAVCDGWYKNDKSCSAVLPGIPCDMKPICRNNVMSETVFRIKDIPPAKV